MRRTEPPVAQLEQLVDLLLVLGRDRPSLGRSRSDSPPPRPARPHRCRASCSRWPATASSLQTQFGRLRPITAPVSPRAKPMAFRPRREVAHLVAIVGPGRRVPDAELLLAHRDVARPVGRVVQQELGEACRARRARAAPWRASPPSGRQPAARPCRSHSTVFIPMPPCPRLRAWSPLAEPTASSRAGPYRQSGKASSVSCRTGEAGGALQPPLRV